MAVLIAYTSMMSAVGKVAKRVFEFYALLHSKGRLVEISARMVSPRDGIENIVHLLIFTCGCVKNWHSHLSILFRYQILGNSFLCFPILFVFFSFLVAIV